MVNIKDPAMLVITPMYGDIQKAKSTISDISGLVLEGTFAVMPQAAGVKIVQGELGGMLKEMSNLRTILEEHQYMMIERWSWGATFQYLGGIVAANGEKIAPTPEIPIAFIAQIVFK